MQKLFLTLLLIFPLLAFSEGQEVFGLVADLIDFVKVFSVWFILVGGILFIYKKTSYKQISKNLKLIIWVGSALIALFTWSMIKHDFHPYSGPIDSLFKSNKVTDYSLPQTDSTIVYTFASVDSNEVGVYIWIDSQRVFVRKLTHNEKQGNGINDSLTKSALLKLKKR